MESVMEYVMECAMECAAQKIVEIWSAWVNLLKSRECRGPFANVEAVHGQQSRCGGVPRGLGLRGQGATWTAPTWMECTANFMTSCQI
jgi:hypothetical protein